MSTLNDIPVVNDEETDSVKFAATLPLAGTVAPSLSHVKVKAFVAFEGLQLLAVIPRVMLSVPVFLT